MSHDRSLPGSFLAGLASTIIALIGFLALVVLELIAAMFVYTYLALYSREWFGYLIGLSRNVLNYFIENLMHFFPGSANAANATVIGELAPKAMLLLLIGLLAGAAIRFAIWLVSRLVRKITG